VASSSSNFQRISWKTWTSLFMTQWNRTQN
jgi:hypothetical protein